MGRNQRENLQISAHIDPSRHITFKVIAHAGPQALLVGRNRQPLITQAAAICAGYSKASGLETVDVSVSTQGVEQRLRVAPIQPAAVADLLL